MSRTSYFLLARFASERSRRSVLRRATKHATGFVASYPDKILNLLRRKSLSRGFTIYMKDITKNYSNGEVTIVWKPGICIHSGICSHGLPGVFDPGRKPWIVPEAADTVSIIGQVKKCPSGALSFHMDNETVSHKEVTSENIVEVTRNGPLLVYGNIVVKHGDGTETRKNKVTAFCRCGASSNKPFCDGSHTKTGFTG